MLCIPVLQHAYIRGFCHHSWSLMISCVTQFSFQGVRVLPPLRTNLSGSTTSVFHDGSSSSSVVQYWDKSSSNLFPNPATLSISSPRLSIAAASRQQQVGRRQRLTIDVQIEVDEVTSSPYLQGLEHVLEAWSLVHWMSVLLFALNVLVAFPWTLSGVG